METITVKNMTIGEGLPKICVPIVAHTKEEILADAVQVAKSKADFVEWRADWFEGVANAEMVQELLYQLGDLLPIPLLFTLRTLQEGGKADFSAETYLKINQAAIDTGCIDLLDVEMLQNKEIAKQLLQSAHAAGVKVIGSSHDFHKTPSLEDMLTTLRSIQDLGADVLKIAVMPQNKGDVLRLLEATTIMREQYAHQPVAAISMGSLGVVSRITGEVFGSTITFGAVQKESAPGQLAVDTLHQLLHEIHKVI